jgi:CyaY protein
MNDSQYHLLADEALQRIEDVIEATEGEIDYEGQSGVLYLYFENGTQMVLNKQEPLHQLWLATKFNGHHFERQNDRWIDTRTGVELYSFLAEVIAQQSGETLQF